MLKEEMCIICPQGCTLKADVAEDDTVSVDAQAGCARGREYLLQELTEPKRVVTSSVLVRNGVLPLVSVRTSVPIPKERIFDVMACIRNAKVDAPVRLGQVVIEGACGGLCDIISTKDISVYGAYFTVHTGHPKRVRAAR